MKNLNTKELIFEALQKNDIIKARHQDNRYFLGNYNKVEGTYSTSVEVLVDDELLIGLIRDERVKSAKISAIYRAFYSIE